MKIRVVRGSVIEQDVDAIVNAANTLMRGGGGIDGRIHERAGPSLLRELQRVAPRGAEVAEAVVTGAGDLPHRFIVHVAGPIWRGGNHGEAELLAASYRNALLAADARGCRRVAFCSLSTGSYRFPLELAAPLAVQTLREATVANVAEVVLAMFGAEEFAVFSAAVG